VLWLLSGPGNADARLRAAAREAGVDPSRLVFMPKLPHPVYLARYQHADLFLDTHPYNAHTTASDALWAGCPVLTAPGATFASRVAGSLNHHLGLAELNVADDAAFVATAVALGNDPRAMTALRAKLAQARADSGLFDMTGFAVDFTAQVEAMTTERGWQGR
jgi:predicted O-linked N-acetylglucosamine transferase (SPINDLY family)